MQKISFEIAKNVLNQFKLLLSSGGNQSSLGFPQNKADEIQEGDIFIAFPGTKVDAHNFIALAIEKGASCLVVEDKNKIPPETQIPYLEVLDGRAAWSVLCSAAYKHPESSLNFFGVTGTDGKTSTVWMASQLIRQAGKSCLSLGTLGVFDGKNHWELNHTTPDPPAFFSALNHAVENKITPVLMEVSSHSLLQGKLHTILFNAGVFTSFSRDHLDFHQTMEDYWSAKCLLFTKHLKKDGRIILHHKLQERFPLEKFSHDQIWTYGFDPEKKVKNKHHVPLLECRPGKRGQLIKFQVNDEILSGEIPYLGIHNAENFIAGLLLAESSLSFFPPSEQWMTLAPIPGRCESIDPLSPGPHVYVDFAHTPEGLKTILRTLRDYTQGRLWLVFGCGGNRDRGKRPEMSKIAETLADTIILTSDNPRHEDPKTILDDMVLGLKNKELAKQILDREEAIAYAIKHAGKDDTVLIAGKGHETYQILGDQKTAFSDQDKARHYLRMRNKEK